MRARALVVRAPLGALAAAAAAVAAGRADMVLGRGRCRLSLGTMLTAAVLLRSWQPRAVAPPGASPGVPDGRELRGLGGLHRAGPGATRERPRCRRLGLVLLAGAAGSTFSERARARTRRARTIRVAFIGSGEGAERLSDDLVRSRFSAYELVGMIGVGGEPDPRVPVVGALGELRAVVLRERIDLLVLGSAVARLTVFDELASSCLDLRLKITELSEFYEDVFGYVPTAEINAAWFAHLVDVHAPGPSPTGQARRRRARVGGPRRAHLPPRAGARGPRAPGRRPSDLRSGADRRRRAPFPALQAAHHARGQRRRGRVGAGGAIRGRPRSGASCAARISTSCPSSSTCSAAR